MLDLPVCIHPNNGASTYAGDMAAVGNGPQTVTLTQQSSTLPELGPDVSPLTLTQENVRMDILRVKIGARGRWEVPRATFPANISTAGSASAHSVVFNHSASPFGFSVGRASEGEEQAPLFSTYAHRLVFKDQYLELTTSVPPSSSLYGLGEFTSSTGLRLARDGLPRALWTRDQTAASPDINTYGAWPFVMEVRPDGVAHGMLLLNSNGMEIVPGPDFLSFRTTGGVLDLYVFSGPRPADVMEQLTAVVGRPYMPPYWSLGLMNSKYGYASSRQLSEVVDGYVYAGIPLETLVTDSQYMDKDQDFTFSKDFPEESMQALVGRMHANRQRWVLILDPCIHVNQNYTPYTTGIAQDVFVKDITGKPYLGQLWPGASHWPDFMNPTTVTWWEAQIRSVYDRVPLDGIWLDMNEVSNYCSGDVCVDDHGPAAAASDFQCTLTCAYGPNALSNVTNGARPAPPAASIFSPPYAISNANQQLNLSAKTLAVTAKHADGTLEYDAHNLYGYMEAVATARALRNIRGKRHFSFSRSTYVGSGAYTAHWTGDVAATWQDLRWSIPSMLRSGLAGIPFVGADICGFMNLASPELCARWIALGAWYPYARVHHAQSFQELYRWPVVTAAARTVLRWRLRALPYTYTAHHTAHITGCPIARPLFFAFPADGDSRGVSTQFMTGDALLVSPILHWNMAQAPAYFPPGRWYSLYDYSPVDTGAYGLNSTVHAGVTDDIPVHVLGGNIVPLATPPASFPFNTTSDAKSAPLTLLVALPGPPGAPPQQRCGGACASGSAACGSMYLDGGEELEAGTARDNFLNFTATLDEGGGRLEAQWSAAGACSSNVTWPALDAVVVMGLNRTINASSLALQMVQGSGAPPTMAALPASKVAYNATAGLLTASALSTTLACPSAVLLTWSWAASAPGGSAAAGR
ncbi:hypothetical protein WJX81_007621 [Elliptochloris bilobata]|uniref:Maltase n=1 Tax=Elliptochloris bilobata TaxID=381761 RepID=A0AAW1RCT6_9CHLO